MANIAIYFYQYFAVASTHLYACIYLPFERAVNKNGDKLINIWTVPVHAHWTTSFNNFNYYDWYYSGTS